jgi:F0F1-type ATP synthase assembly protein I
MSADKSPSSHNKSKYLALGMSLGLLFGALLGVLVWISTDEFVFFTIFTGGGMTVGLSIGLALDEKQESG